jgi:lipopolysaccharide/colanic/teichoic acid biosynthesis glycosyltransferase
MYISILKPISDFIISIILLLILFPLYLCIYVIIFITLNENPIFKQERVGLDNNIFVIKKFKTMTTRKDRNGNLLPDSQRLTKIGNFLRKLSADEMPQLFNVIKGDMSFVGPRPLLPEYLPLYSEVQRRRHEVKPGITGWAQVNGRNSISWDKKFELDVWYVDNVSFRIDLLILWKTIFKVIARDNISSNYSVTMEKFKGQNKNNESKNC